MVLKDRHAKEIADLEKTWDIELERRLELELTDDMTPEEKQNKESLIRNEVKLAHAKARFQFHAFSLAPHCSLTYLKRFRIFVRTAGTLPAIPKSLKLKAD